MNIAIIGGGPAGLMAAEAASAAGAQVDLYDGMASVGRKFLLAGKGGLNLTHSELSEKFLSRYGVRRAQIAPLLASFGPDALRAWARGLGIETFVGSSGRVFPYRSQGRAIAARMAPSIAPGRCAIPHASSVVRLGCAGGVCALPRQRETALSSPMRWCLHSAAAVGRSLALMLHGCRCWQERGVQIAPLQPANCGFDVGWSEHFRTKFAGHPVKSVAIVVRNDAGAESWHPGEFVITETGVEGGVIYAVSASLRDEILAKGVATLRLDLAPDRDLPRLTHDLSRPRGKRTMATHLQRQAHIEGVKAGLLREVVSKEDFVDPARLAASIKALPLRLVAPRPLEEAISTAGGVAFEALDERLMIRALPGMFCAGEMLDWEAPTGGYLLTACFATGQVAGAGAVAWLNKRGTRGAG